MTKLDGLAQTSYWIVVYLYLGLILNGHYWAKIKHQSPQLKTFPITLYTSYEGNSQGSQQLYFFQFKG